MKIHGIGASFGKMRGLARVINSNNSNNSNYNEFKKGEILVTKMTDPSMTIIMGKASAIVTDLGGLGCHAAIIARELGIPCVVGTKIATKVIKTGQIIEVNAENGEISLI